MRHLARHTIDTQAAPSFQTMIQIAPDMRRVQELKTENTSEVLTFLSVRPVHTVVMTSFINDNGIESDLNRGVYYGYRGRQGKLEGVALIGHSTLVEARSDEALRALVLRHETLRRRFTW
ncbi:MAG: hypothetical protein WBD16_03600 [Pyrinomonadaceae bacterium]